MSKSILIGIVSYLPNDLKTRYKKIKIHLKQLTCLNNLYPDIDILQVNLNYESYDVQKFNRIGTNSIRDSFIQISYDKLDISKARNVILQYFYHSDYQFLMLMNDDTILYTYYDTKNFLMICQRGKIKIISV